MVVAESPWDAILNPDVLGNIGAGALLALFIIAILRGGLVTRTQYNDLKDQRDRWESAYWKEKEASALQDRQNDELMETARTMKYFMEAFPRPLAPEREEPKK
jgi:hypothetical protein